MFHFDHLISKHGIDSLSLSSVENKSFGLGVHGFVWMVLWSCLKDCSLVWRVSWSCPENSMVLYKGLVLSHGLVSVLVLHCLNVHHSVKP